MNKNSGFLESDNLEKSQNFRKLDFYFRPKKLERWKDGLIYKSLGVDIFKKIVPSMGTYVTKLTNFHPIREAPTKEEGLKWLEKNSRLWEGLHLGVMPVATAVNGYFFLNGIKNGDVFDTVLNGSFYFGVNIYPIMLQRYNRARIYNYFYNIGREEELKFSKI